MTRQRAAVGEAVAPTQVLFIGGSGRSGSTMLDMILGANSSAFSLGQVDRMRPWLEREELCTCTARLRDCRFWSRVLDGDDRSDWPVPPPLNPDRRVPKFVALVFAAILGEAPRGSASHADEAWRLLDRIAEIAGTPVLVDSSKAFLRFAALVARRPDRIRFVHVVRDIRGYVASRSSPKSATTPAGEVTLPAEMTRPEALVNWLVHNGLLYVLGGWRYRRVCMTVSYEELIRQPERVLAAIATFAGMRYEAAMLPPIASDGYHLVSGNTGRFSGYTALRLDERWREILGPVAQAVIWVLAAPLQSLLRRRAAHDLRRFANATLHDRVKEGL